MADIPGLGVAITHDSSAKLRARAGNLVVLGFVVDSTNPVVTLLSPAEGSPLAPTGAVSFRVTDDLGLGRTVVSVQQGTNRELAHDETGFVGLYASSTKSAVTGGFDFELRRTGGWSSAPTIYVSPNDLGGNLAS